MVVESKVKPTSFDQYFAPLPDDQRAALEHIRQLVHTLVPDADETITYDMPTFKLRGKGILWFGAAVKHCAIYGVPAALCAEVPEYSASGKGTLRFVPTKPLPDELIRRIVEARVHKIEALAR